MYTFNYKPKLKRKVNLAVSFLILFSSVHAQEIINCGDFCLADLRNPIPHLLTNNDNPITMPYFKNPSNPIAQPYDVNYHNEGACDGHDDEMVGNFINNDGQATDCNDMNTSLYFDVYYPTNYNYQNCKLPAVILFHGGSYLECSDKTNPGVVELCKYFSLRGFVVFSVEYRRGVIGDRNSTIPVDPFGNQNILYTSAQQIVEIYRACQDGRGAIRSIIQYEKTGWGFGHPWHIDINKIFVGGVSAGSLVAMSCVYYQSQAQWDAIFGSNIETSLGPIDPDASLLNPPTDFYYADKTTKFPDYQSTNGTILGVIDCWGALMVPATAGYNTTPYSFFTSNFKNPPIIIFHGKHDATFSYNRQGLYFSWSGNGSQYTSENHCLFANYQFESNDKHIDRIELGGQSIYEMFRSVTPIPIFSEFYLDCDMAHGLDKTHDANCHVCGGYPSKLLPTCIPCNYRSNFGCDVTDADHTYEYMASRGASFFQAILGGLSTNTLMLAGASKFVECQNKRNKCTTADDNAGCCNADNCDNNCQGYSEPQ
jgi:hypothetical protein